MLNKNINSFKEFKRRLQKERESLQEEIERINSRGEGSKSVELNESSISATSTISTNLTNSISTLSIKYQLLISLIEYNLDLVETFIHILLNKGYIEQEWLTMIKVYSTDQNEIYVKVGINQIKYGNQMIKIVPNLFSFKKSSIDLFESIHENSLFVFKGNEILLNELSLVTGRSIIYLDLNYKSDNFMHYIKDNSNFSNKLINILLSQVDDLISSSKLGLSNFCQNSVLTQFKSIFASLCNNIGKNYERLTINEQKKWIIANCLFSIIWSFGARVDYTRNRIFDKGFKTLYHERNLIRIDSVIDWNNLFPCLPRDDSTVFDIFYDETINDWALFNEKRETDHSQFNEVDDFQSEFNDFSKLIYLSRILKGSGSRIVLIGPESFVLAEQVIKALKYSLSDIVIQKASSIGAKSVFFEKKSILNLHGKIDDNIIPFINNKTIIDDNRIKSVESDLIFVNFINATCEELHVLNSTHSIIINIHDDFLPTLIVSTTICIIH
ncbi:hypothetical protein ROZALSC1DRAFT_22248 [Rozella allomycis CSF55]|uniref:Dynein heavy chain AAA 5 extension domain-containing protein n=1 Tax=Rozella allomycis (strain CSF55) TaxID=988480 RepID=A0A4P9YJC2_ROZAC|nr:hypothetical protein ROZALSC1DRAFT_22248 [Rozella allomycis CSF55]